MKQIISLLLLTMALSAKAEDIKKGDEVRTPNFRGTVDEVLERDGDRVLRVRVISHGKPPTVAIFNRADIETQAEERADKEGWERSVAIGCGGVMHERTLTGHHVSGRRVGDRLVVTITPEYSPGYPSCLIIP